MENSPGQSANGQRLLEPAGRFALPDQLQAGPAVPVHVVLLDGDATGLPETGQSLLGVLVGEPVAEVGQRPSLLASGPGPAGGVQRLLGRLAGFGASPDHQEQLDVPGQDPGPLGRGRLGGDQADRLLVGGQGAVVEGQPEAASEPLPERPSPDRVAGRVHPVQGLPQELGRPRVVVGHMGRGGGPLEQADRVEPGQPGRPRHV